MDGLDHEVVQLAERELQLSAACRALEAAPNADEQEAAVPVEQVDRTAENRRAVRRRVVDDRAQEVVTYAQQLVDASPASQSGEKRQCVDAGRLAEREAKPVERRRRSVRPERPRAYPVRVTART